MRHSRCDGRRHRSLSSVGYDLSRYLRFVFCVSADAATDFTVAGVLGLDSNREACVATRLDVVSLRFVLVMIGLLPVGWVSGEAHHGSHPANLVRGATGFGPSSFLAPGRQAWAESHSPS